MRYVLVISFVLTAAFAFASATPWGRSKAFPNTNACFLDLYAAPITGATVLITGSSRIRRGINLSQIEDILERPSGSAYNYSHPSISLPFDYNLIDQALTDNVDVELVVMGIVPRSSALLGVERELDPRGNAHLDVTLSGGAVTKLYVGGARPEAQFDLIDDLNPAAPRLALWEKFHISKQRLTQFIPNALRILEFENFPVDPGRPNECFVAAWDDQQKVTNFGRKAELKKAEYQERFDDGHWVDPEPLGFFTDQSNALDHFMIERLIDRVEAHGAKPVFLYFPSMFAPVSPVLSETFLDGFGVPLIVPSPLLRSQLEDGMYFDNSHLNTQGRLVFSEWLGTQLVPILQGRAE